MNINVVYFARYREAMGMDGEELNGTFATLEDVRQELLERGGNWSVLGEANLMCACNQDLCKLDEPVADGDEVAFFPPVTGG
ncbi:molybdenum cofactor biosynthesis protein D [Pseudomonas sp. M47T1]|uniref:molybdopterin converting factor subunit 1 n=1 Tax=Pseudomonas sp. M47T1 TaxID=1179778 RepID=UPI00026067CA|nr:molybdopterin converting factor subunit 1 [Pseudomonas sp. M47T1]EIK95326.1 molybdenum cofactor biosynthesis protein D [Pseudomonas sp. M47T1]